MVFRFIVYCVLRVSVRGIELNYILRGALLPGFWGPWVWFSGPWVFWSLGLFGFCFYIDFVFVDILIISCVILVLLENNRNNAVAIMLF